MSYDATTWNKGDVITAAKLNKMEQAVANAVTEIEQLKAALGSTTDSRVNGLILQLNALKTRVTELENEVSTKHPQQPPVEVVTTLADVLSAVNNPDDNIKLSMPASGKLQAGIKNITAKSLDVTEVNMESSRLNIKVAENCVMANVNTSGDLAKSVSNAAISVNGVTNKFVFKDSTINASGYNCLEVGLNSGAVKSALIENVTFAGKLSNNAILVFGTEDNAIVTVKNCTFEDCSNAIRLSNKSNVHVTLNIEDCTFKKLESNPEYTGVLLCQDYTSTAEASVTNNLFAPSKVSVNFINCTGPDGQKITAPADLASVLGSKTASQLVYVYTKAGFVDYDPERYPTVAFA